MADLRKMTVESLRELARKKLGAGHSRLKTKGELVRALEKLEAKVEGEGGEAARAPGTPARRAAGRAAAATGKAVRAAKDAGKSAREGARAVARAGKAAAEGAAEGARAGARVAKERGTGAVAKAAAAAVGAVAGAVAGAKRVRGAGPPEGLPDPEGYFVARVRGEEAARVGPHGMAEAGSDEPCPQWAEGVGGPGLDEGLGELPWGYGDDAFVALPRDPSTLFLYWDHSGETVRRAFDGMDHARAQLWLFLRTDVAWDRIRTVEFALESRGYYVHELDPGRTYRAEIHSVDRHGNDRLLGRGSNEVTLPRVGPSPVLDDRFIRIPWDMPFGRLLGPGHPGSPFPDDARALLERLSDWTRFSSASWGGSAGGMGGRPSSPTSSPSSPPGTGSGSGSGSGEKR